MKFSRLVYTEARPGGGKPVEQVIAAIRGEEAGDDD